MGSNYLDSIFAELSPDHLKYSEILKKGSDALTNCHSIFSSDDFKTKTGWKNELEKDGISIYSMPIQQGRLYSTKYEMSVPLATFISDDWDGVENIPKWNEDVDFARRLVKLTDNADIVHYANKQILMVSGRDYLSIRIRREIDGIIYTSAYSIEDSINNVMPEVDGKVRGFLHVNGGRFQSHPVNSNVTIIENIICLDIKGMLPKGLINSQMPKQLHKSCQTSQNRMKNQQKT